MARNMFSDLRDGEVSHTRRVLHSAKNYFQTVHLSKKDHSSLSLANVSGAGGQAMGVMGVVAGSAMIGWATGAAATGAFAAAVSGPQAAVVLGVIGVAMALKSAYSNREKNHNILSKHVYNMVDDEVPPTFDEKTLKEAAAAANYLISEGQNQFELVASKYQTASAALTTYVNGLKKNIDDFNSMTATGAARGKAQADAISGWNAAREPGGAIFNFVRRCCHTGNYLQAPHVMHLAIVNELSGPAHVVLGTADAHAKHFHEAQIVIASRQSFKALESMYNANSAAYVAAHPGTPNAPRYSIFP